MHQLFYWCFQRGVGDLKLGEEKENAVLAFLSGQANSMPKLDDFSGAALYYRLLNVDYYGNLYMRWEGLFSYMVARMMQGLINEKGSDKFKADFHIAKLTSIAHQLMCNIDQVVKVLLDLVWEYSSYKEHERSSASIAFEGYSSASRELVTLFYRAGLVGDYNVDPFEILKDTIQLEQFDRYPSFVHFMKKITSDRPLEYLSTLTNLFQFASDLSQERKIMKGCGFSVGGVSVVRGEDELFHSDDDDEDSDVDDLTGGMTTATVSHKPIHTIDEKFDDRGQPAPLPDMPAVHDTDECRFFSTEGVIQVQHKPSCVDNSCVQQAIESAAMQMEDEIQASVQKKSSDTDKDQDV